ncbi:Metallopeptidase [Leptospira biflexa serovar Patoc strain 'Patoc 1 (Ames)']|uniref:Putative peptidase, M37 family putative signal peptide n=1 Tax=Leptospira biflexa serovar Patoc (strain Patoc 1 / ATCC 23582 / Paris) TaxID=456481 RepID=B0SRV4_LEPBP|nr:M23 family metallopeptidase [Leptospira biflexa]ABZ95778.1 Metallopeptidase [Leptospira biflexa serovar Patoc strain 'Patoc 1 (Ames)']ABZ99489.1 Putative peptidase, M37 family; putative signal peptide [Leptospira biflexa serovar Patoc strain 'Patoc 1 (Paris)']
MMVRSISILSFILFFVQAVPAESREVKKKIPKHTVSSGNYFVKKEEKNFSLLMEARRFGRGEVIFLRLTPKDKKWINESYKLSWLGKDVILTKRENSMIAFLPISPDTPAGAMTLEIVSKIFFVKRGQKQYQIILEPTKFQVIKKNQQIKVDEKFVTKELPKETLDFIQECKNAKETAFTKSSQLQFQKNFKNPLESIYITSKFYVRRDYNNKQGRPHGGVDFRGKTGTPILAIQDGTVVLAQKTYYEGNFTIIDHGNKIFSFYMHQDEIKVKVGELVKQGQQIGTVGTTGMSTGPHLHLGAKINGVLVDPLSLIALQSISESN